MTSNRKLSKLRPLPPCADAEEERMRERLPIILEAIRRKNGYRYEYLTLGFFYEVGFLLEQDLKKAAEHYSRISRIDWSKKRFAELVSKIYPEWLDSHSEQENSELFKRLIPHAHEGNRWAEIAVAYAYQYGVGVSPTSAKPSGGICTTSMPNILAYPKILSKPTASTARSSAFHPQSRCSSVILVSITDERSGLR